MIADIVVLIIILFIYCLFFQFVKVCMWIYLFFKINGFTWARKL